MKYGALLLLVSTFTFSSLAQDSKKSLEELNEWIYDQPKSIAGVDSVLKAIDSLRNTDLELFKTYAQYALDVSREINYPKGLSSAYNLVGVYYINIDSYEKAMENYITAMQIMDSIGNEKGVAVISANIGIIYDQLGQPDNAKKSFQRSYSYFKQINHERYMNILELNLGAAHFYLEEYDSALYYFQTIIPFRQANQDTHGLAVAYSNIGEIYGKTGDYSKSIENYHRALALLNREHDLLNDVYAGIGRSYLGNNRPKKGLAYLDSALDLAIETKQKRFEEVVYAYRKEYFEKTGNYKKAYDNLSKQFDINEELRGEEVQSQIEVLNLKYEDEKKAKQLAVLETQRAQDQLYLLYTAGGGGFALVIAILLMIMLRLKIKNAKLKEQELQIKLEHKTKELTSYAINFIQKNELMQELTVKIDEFKTKSDTTGIRDLNQMNKIINSSFRIDQDWENFKVMFEEIHSGFIMSLKDRFPELGNAELKLCALLRLNMNLKEASTVLGISPDSVKTARYRLRKKLALSTEDNLVDFLIQFDNERMHKQSA